MDSRVDLEALVVEAIHRILEPQWSESLARSVLSSGSAARRWTRRVTMSGESRVRSDWRTDGARECAWCMIPPSARGPSSFHCTTDQPYTDNVTATARHRDGRPADVEPVNSTKHQRANST